MSRLEKNDFRRNLRSLTETCLKTKCLSCFQWFCLHQVESNRSFWILASSCSTEEHLLLYMSHQSHMVLRSLFLKLKKKLTVLAPQRLTHSRCYSTSQSILNLMMKTAKTASQHDFFPIRYFNVSKQDDYAQVHIIMANLHFLFQFQSPRLFLTHQKQTLSTF